MEHLTDKRNKKILIYAAVLIVAVFAAYSFTSRETGPGEYDAFAQCLTENGAMMYGADWCPHCNNQKELFGKSWEYINYIECESNKDACLAAGIQGYPTWRFSDGSEQSGEVTFQFLSQKTGCPVQ